MNHRSIFTRLAAGLALAATASPALADTPVQDWYLDIYPKTTARAAVDSNDNLAAGGLHYTEKYAPDGTLLWHREFSLASQPFYTNLSWLAVDSQDNVVRGGYQEAYAGVQAGYLAVKYDPAGNLLWYSHLVNLPGQAFRCELDEFDNIYLFGESSIHPAGGPRWLTVKLDPNGQEVWHRWGHFGEPVDLEVRDGQVVGAGHGNGGVFLTTSYDYNGNVNWENTYQRGSAFGDMAIGPNGQVVLCGWGSDGTINSFGTVVQYDPQGNEQWVTLYNSPYGGIEILRRLAIDDTGAVITIGDGISAAQSNAWSILKLDPAGGVLWAQLYDNDAGFYEQPHSVAVGPGNAIYVGGLSDRLGPCGFGSTEGHVVKYSSSGVYQWHHHIQCGGSPRQIVFDGTGALYAVPLYDLLRLHEELGDAYCAANANSTGTPASISATGSASSSAGILTLTSAAVPNSPGLFFHGTSQAQIPFGNGFLCASGGLRRGAVVQATGNSVSYTYDNSGPPRDLSGFVGQTRRFQHWFRDVMGGGALFNLSNGISIPVLP